jgi:hypothetical protein
MNLSLWGSILPLSLRPKTSSKVAHEQEMITARAQHSAVDERWHVRKDGSLFWASGFLTFCKTRQGNLVAMPR